MTPTALILVDISASMKGSPLATVAAFAVEVSAHLPMATEVRCISEGLPFWTVGDHQATTRTDWKVLLDLLALQQPLILLSDFVPSCAEDLDALMSLQLEATGRKHPVHSVVVDPSRSDIGIAAMLQWPRRAPWTSQEAIQLAQEIAGSDG